MEPKARQILILSSDGELRDWLVEAARDVDASMVACEALERALEEIKRREVALVVLTVPAPGTSSWEDAIGRVRKFRDDLGFVLVSSRADPTVLLNALRLAVLDHVTVTGRTAAEAKEVAACMDRALSRTQGLRESIAVLRELRSVVDDFMEHMRGVDKEFRDLKTRMSDMAGNGATGGTVLLVEDDPQVARSAADAMKAEGYRVATASTGERALKAAADSEFQVVVLEQNLTDIHGLELMRQLRAVQPEADYIFIVGFTEADSAVLALRSGASAFMIKPYSPEDLSRRVSELTASGQLKRRSREYFEDFRRRYQGFLDKYENLIARLQHHGP